jgi:BirA family biotin operon repressor/biotin-[acetyl-CoA-carboxylase] ligase
MEILRLLADGQFHSGVHLAEALGVSRTTISNRIGQWQERGLAIDCVSGKGYRLAQPLELLDKELLRSLLPEDIQQQMSLLTVPVLVSSTNDVVTEALNQQKKSGIVCIAEMQQAGRGRRGRTWLSPPAGNFYGSVGWIFRQGFDVLEGLSLAVGVAVIQALEAAGATGLSLKWPNDILWQQQKLGGVLIEMSGEAGGPCQVVIGVGVNLHLPAQIKSRIDQACVDLVTVCGTPINRHQVSAAIIASLIRLLAHYAEQGFAGWRQQWLQYDAFANQAVTVLGGQTPITGIACGVDERGALLINRQGALVTIHGGEVSLRRQEL